MTVNTSNGLGGNDEIQQICDCRDILHHVRQTYGQMSQATETVSAFLSSKCLKMTRVISDKLNEIAKY